jgi:glycyl-tRNA synthetase alpha chain
MMIIQNVDNVYDLVWTTSPDGTTVSYGDVFKLNERQYSAYNYEVANVAMLLNLFTQFEEECESTLAANLPIPAYDYVLKCSHVFNLLDARGAISATERQAYILRVRKLAKQCCEVYLTPADSSDNSEDNTDISSAALASCSKPTSMKKGGDK